jgi:hypothetical protein
MATDYGTDVYCATGFISSMPSIDGMTSIAHTAVRGLQTPNGMVDDWPDWGEDLRQFANSKVRAEVVAMRARRQILRDERVRACKVTGERSTEQANTIDLTAILVTEEFGPFSFVMTVTQAAVDLISLQAG